MNDVNFLEKITITVKNTKPIEVQDFLKSVNAFQKEYRNICKQENIKYNSEEVKLYIQVREGSVEWDFIRKISTEHPILISSCSIGGLWLLKKTVEVLYEQILLKIINGKEKEVTVADVNTLTNARDSVSIQKNDSGAILSINGSNNKGDIYSFENCTFNGVQARGAMDFLDDKIGQQINNSDFCNSVMQLTCTDKNQIKGIIEDINDKPKVIIFSNQDIKNQIITKNEHNPLIYYYIVNGTIKKYGDKIVAYVVNELIEKISTADID